MKRGLSLILALSLLLALSACARTPAAESGAEAPLPSPAVADASQMTTVEEVVEEGMVPVYGESLADGDWPVEVKSSSSMFRIAQAVLHVHDGALSATLTLSGTSYLFVYPGTALEADAAEEEERIPYVEDENGAYTFTLPVEGLDMGVPCAAFSKNKQLWYERTLLLRADSLPMEAFREGFFVTAESLGLADGVYSAAVRLSGGSGRAGVTSPARIELSGGVCTARIEWGSPNYDYMRIGDERFEPVNTEGNSCFEIPLPYFDRPFAVIADTVAMSEPHEIAYTLVFDSSSLERAA